MPRQVHAASASAGAASVAYGFGELPIERLTAGRYRLVYTIEMTMRQIPR
ncbi:hypothetical protein ACCD06_33830 [Azospirillum sp. CT11-132]